MALKTFFVLALCIVISTSQLPAVEKCGNTTITGWPRVSGDMMDGVWHPHMAKAVFPNAKIFISNDGTKNWGMSWIPTVKICAYLETKLTQQQDLNFGPFVPCFDQVQINPPDTNFNGKAAVYMPNDNVALIYTCPGEVNANNMCIDRVDAKVVTRTNVISDKDIEDVNVGLIKVGMPPLDRNIVNTLKPVMSSDCSLPDKYKGKA